MEDGYFEKNSEPLSTRIRECLERFSLLIRHQQNQQRLEFGVTPTQSDVMLLLRQLGRPARLGEIATHLQISSPTLSESVKTLASKGFVEANVAGDDRRARAIQLTQSGTEATDRLKSTDDALNTAVLECDPQELLAVFNGLQKILVKLLEKGAIPIDGMCRTCKHFGENEGLNPPRIHRCHLVGEDFGEIHLRIHCPDHEPHTPRA